MPEVKSRGFGSSSSAAGPLPSPFSPWQPMHLSSYTTFPAAAFPCAHAGEADAMITSPTNPGSQRSPMSPTRLPSVRRTVGRERRPAAGAGRHAPPRPVASGLRSIHAFEEGTHTEVVCVVEEGLPTRAGRRTPRATRRATTRPGSVGLMRFFPSPRLLSRRVVQVHDHLPDLLLGEPVLPRGHDGVPGGGFPRQPGAALRDPPEEVRLLEHRDGAGVLEVRGRRIEPLGEVALPVQVVAVAVHAIADVDDGARRDVLFEVRLVLPQRVVEDLDGDLLAAELDRGLRSRVDRAE